MARQALLDAALARFARDGVASTSLDAIRRDAGVSVGSLYHAFPGGKVELTAALYVEVLTGYQEAFTARLRRARSAEAGIRGQVEFHLRWHARHPEAARFLHATREPALREATAPALRERNRAFFADIRRWFAPHLESGVVRDLPLPVLHALWLGPAQELCRHWIAGTTAAPDHRTRDLLADAAWQALSTT